MRESISRRQFIALLGAVGGATALGWEVGVRAAGVGEAPAGPPVPGRGQNRRIVVLGGGLSGLCAAYNLRASGAEVVVLEAAGVVGGRVKTVRRPFINGGYAEAGAVRIMDGHAFTMKYVKQFGLETELVELPDGNKLWYLDQKRFLTPPAGELWPVEGMSDAERKDPLGAVDRYLAPAFSDIGDVHDPRWPRAYPGAVELDRFRFREYLRRQGASEAWIRFFGALEGNLFDANTAQLIGMLKADHSTRTFGLRGGNDQLPKAFAATLGGRVQVGASVVRVENGPSAVTVTYLDRTGRRQQLSCDYCVCTIPFPALRRVKLHGFDDEKMRAIAEYQMVPISRVYLQTRSRFWEDDRLGRLSGLRLIGTDTKAERIWNTSGIQPAKEGMLQAYLFGANAEALRALPEDHRTEAIITEMETFLPGVSDQVVASYVKIWSEDPLAGGAVAFAKPGQMWWILDAARRPAGRTHFAGEHTVARIAWMNGALESGERVAEEILIRIADEARTAA
jgi:monoamine oxidase